MSAAVKAVSQFAGLITDSLELAASRAGCERVDKATCKMSPQRMPEGLGSSFQLLAVGPQRHAMIIMQQRAVEVQRAAALPNAILQAVQRSWPVGQSHIRTGQAPHIC